MKSKTRRVRGILSLSEWNQMSLGQRLARTADGFYPPMAGGANQIPLSGAANASGGYLLPTEYSGPLTTGILRASGTIQLCGDTRQTSSRKEVFSVWLGRPTAGPVGEGARKPVTGAEIGTMPINVVKFASIIPFTDEMREDVATGDLDVLVDTDVRSAIADSIDAHMIGKAGGTDLTSVFDTALRSTSSTVELGTTNDSLRKAISAAMGVLESNGYGNVANMGLLLPGDAPQQLRDARSALDSTLPLYAGPGSASGAADPFYGLDRQSSTNLNTLGTSATSGLAKGFVVYKPNLHLRLRKDVTVSVSSEATINDGTSDRFMWQEDMTGLRFVTRLGFAVHDVNRAVVKIIDAS